MKKFLVLFTTASLLLACGASKTVRDSRKVMNGEWLLQSVTYSEAGSYSITLLNDASKDCFEGSVWRFVANNYSGRYEISGGGCPVGERHFMFDIDEVDAATGYYDFMLKPTDAKGRSETNRGFRLRLTQLSDVNMTWEQNLMVDGKPFTLYMNFVKFN